MLSTLNSPILRSPYVKYAALAFAGGITTAVMPGILLRIGEFEAYLLRHPLRSSIELAGSTTLLGSVLGQLIGYKCPTIITEALQRHIPAVSRLLERAHPLASLALRAFLGATLFYSFCRGISPPHQRTLLSLHGKTALVTGGTSGIGLETTRVLARQGAKIILVARNKQKALNQAAIIVKETPEAQISVLVADQTDLAAVASLEAELERESPNGIDIVLLNAGATCEMPPKLGPSGYESSITSMHLSHFLLMKMAWRRLNAHARVAITSSAAHAGGPFYVETVFEALTDVNDPNSRMVKDGSYMYGRAKYANALFAKALGKHADTDSRHILVSSHHPGAVATAIWDSISYRPVAHFLNTIAPLTMRTIPQGAATLIDALAGSSPMEGQETAPNGSYYVSSAAVNRGICYRDVLDRPDQVPSLWQRSEEYIKPFEPASATWNVQ